MSPCSLIYNWECIHLIEVFKQKSDSLFFQQMLQSVTDTNLQLEQLVSTSVSVQSVSPVASDLPAEEEGAITSPS